jgi:hypothetical protein
MDLFIKNSAGSDITAVIIKKKAHPVYAITNPADADIVVLPNDASADKNEYWLAVNCLLHSKDIYDIF